MWKSIVSFTRAYRVGVWFGFVRFTLLAVVLCWVDRYDSWELQDLFCLLRVTPVLVLPSFDKPFAVVCDACELSKAVGTVLLHDGYPVAYMSKKLGGPELMLVQ